jgi:hypothetical protein
MMNVGFAQEPASSRQEDSNATKPSTQPVSAQPQSNEGLAPAHNSKVPDDIDTRISVQPHPNDGRDKGGNGKLVKSVAPRNLLAPRNLARGASAPAMRNSIGAAAIGREGAERYASPRISNSVHSTASGIMSVVGNPTGHLANSVPAVGRPAPNPNAIIRPGPLNAKIDGTGIFRPGSGPSGIGGPAKSLAGINGTAIRPRP